MRIIAPFVALSLTAAALAEPKQHTDYPVPDHPVVAGEAFFEAGSVEAGEVLLAELSCTACHKASDAAEARLRLKKGPVLGEIASRMTPQYLRDWIKAPHDIRPGTTMPDVFHGSEGPRRDMAVDMLTHYLMSLSKPLGNSTVAADPAMIRHGRELYHTVGCVACHSPQAPPAEFNKEFAAGEDYGDDDDNKDATRLPKLTRPSVPLGNALGRKTTVDALAAFLLDPLKHRPSGRMPNVGLDEREAKAIAAYLLREQAEAEGADALVAGMRYEYVEGNIETLEDFERLDPKRTGHAKSFDINPNRGDYFGFRFRGSINIPADGKYTFYTASDDGSWLLIDGKVVVDNGGIHGVVEKNGSIELTAGFHSIDVRMFEAAGGEELRVSWQGPGFGKQAIPADVLFHAGKAMKPLGEENFVVDANKARTGKFMFAALRCASCHQIEKGENVAPFSDKPMTPLAKLNVDNDEGCLGDNVRKGWPQYQLSTAQKKSLKAAVAAAKLEQFAKPRNTEADITHTLASLNCFACHERGGVGGPDAGRLGYFRINGDAELGDEGRLPRALTHVGAKLKPEALTGILETAGWRVRPYMATRMPQFGKANVGELAKQFEQADYNDPAQVQPPFKLDEELAKVGRQLVGTSTVTQGFACVNCHNVAGRKSLGVPAIDLATMYTRLRKDWYVAFMKNPASFNKNTRMPNFFPEGKSTLDKPLGGDADKQIEAMWHYLSLGKSMPLPPGMAQLTKGDELIPADVPIVFRTFMTDASPRAIAVGNPELVHFAFDANVVRLAKAWRGRFFDPSGTWEGRAGQFRGPLGTDVIDMPPGPAFVIAGKEFPNVGKESRDVGGEFKGYRLDEQRRPIFRYEFAQYTIDEQPVPKFKAGGAVLVRQFNLETKARPVVPLMFRAAVGQQIEKQSADTWLIDGKVTVTLRSRDDAALSPKVRDVDGQKELVVGLPLREGKAAFEVEIDW